VNRMPHRHWLFVECGLEVTARQGDERFALERDRRPNQRRLERCGLATRSRSASRRRSR
jgi:hypothetical protein